MEIMKVCISKIVNREQCGWGEAGGVGGRVGGEFLLKKDTLNNTQQTKGQWKWRRQCRETRPMFYADPLKVCRSETKQETW